MGKERRKHPRKDLVAQVAAAASEVTHLLRCTNASRTGLFLQGTPDRYPHFSAGDELQIHIITLQATDAPEEEGPESVDVSARARIVRVEGSSEDDLGGFALEFTSIDREQEKRWAELLADP